MSKPYDFSFERYLSAKKSVDDRALNRQVIDALKRELEIWEPSQTLRVLELGAGIGTMLERMLEWKLLPDKAHYWAIDSNPDNIVAVYPRLQQWASQHQYVVTDHSPQSLTITRGNQEIQITLDAIDVYDFAAREKVRQSWNLLISHAFLDLIDLPAGLPRLLELLKLGGLFYFTINFDGLTILEPVLDPHYDEHVLSTYHRTMDDRLIDGKRSGDSRTGRHLFSLLQNAGTDVLAAGSSDWVVFASQGTYPEDEAHFLHFIVHTIDTALHDHPEIAHDLRRFETWIASRHAQIERGEMVYIAHQMDFVGRRSG